LENAVAKGDIESYRIAIHSLKSTSLTIGAVQLSEMAKALEIACKENNVEYVREQHEKCMDAYKMILDKLSKFLEAGDM
jgi:HPt (histidine-containing phosphotransfer) domain-containing protein